MDAREQLRRYLEQRREMGETELVLDSMGVDEALSLITGASAGQRPATPVEREAPASPVERGTPVATPRVEREVAGGSSDWRAALRAAGAGPSSVESVAPKAPAAPTESAPPVGIPPVPTAHAIPASLEVLVKEIAACTKCPLYATALNPVPGEGNPNADFMCVGEAPGATEDELGRPFVGAAGQLLTKILAAINLSRDDVYICNVLKHRPPGNRNPAPDEVTACSPYLIRQIEIVKPKVILALGTFAAQTLLNTKTPIGKLRGQVHQYYGVPLVVTYHPAALLRNPSWKRPTWEDVQLARQILDSPPAGV